VKGGEHELLTIELRPVHRGPALATGAAPPRDGDASLWSSPWLWTGVGALVVGGVVTALVLARDSDDPELERGDLGEVVLTLRRAP
jgi:hypothetical protein